MQRIKEGNALVNNSFSIDKPDTVFGQRHYTVGQVAEMWNISWGTIRRLFLGEDGVLQLVRPGNRYKRTYVTLRIPESVLNRLTDGLRVVMPNGRTLTGMNSPGFVISPFERVAKGIWAVRRSRPPAEVALKSCYSSR
jgi:hypothetical protein